MTDTNDRHETANAASDVTNASHPAADLIETTIDRGMATDFGAAPDDDSPAAMTPGDVSDAAESADADEAAAEPDAASAPASEPELESESESDDEDDSEDSLTYSNGVIEKIVAMATREVPHVLGMKGNLWHSLQEQFGAENLTKGVTVEVTDDNRVVVNISVIIEYGAYAPAIFEDVKDRVTERLAAMTGLEVAGINLRIEDVVTQDEDDAGQKHLIDNIMPGNGDDEEADSGE